VINTAFAPGKIILSGEYAVVFGYAGIAMPAPIGIVAEFTEQSDRDDLELVLGGHDEVLRQYLQKIVDLCQQQEKQQGTLHIQWNLPLGKGMGSSTAFVIAISRALLGDDRAAALKIEDTINPGHSGLDFAVVWENESILFKKGDSPQIVSLPTDILREATLIDTGFPSDSTPDLVAWVKSREQELRSVLVQIGTCTERLMYGELLSSVMRDHHKAQVALGVVPDGVAGMIDEIELTGGAAKVIGAGSRHGGGGMVLAIGDREAIKGIVDKRKMSILAL
jgi:mevalonate kinase